MSKTIRKIFLPLLCALVVLCLAGATACKKTQTYSITVAECLNGTVTADKAEASDGEEVTLTVTPDEGYKLETLKVNDTETEVSEGKASFTMPAENVNVTASFTKKNEGGEDLGKDEYAVNLGNAEGVTLTADKTKAKEGETVTLTAEASYGYKIVTLKLNGADLTLSEGKATFKMPAASADVTVTSALADNVLTAPRPEGLELKCKIIRDEAVSVWVYEYTETSLDVQVYVSDAKVNGELDAVELYACKFGFDYINLGEHHFGVKVSADGTVEHFRAVDGEYVSATESAITVLSATPWSEDGTKLDGYAVKLSLSYEKLGIEGAADDGAICALPVLNNYTNTLGISATYNGYEKTSANSYPTLSGGEWKENYYLHGAGMLGGTAAIPAGDRWDLSHDYPAEDTENYENRKVVLNGHDNKDNNLVFFRNSGKNVYARATFKATGVIGDEKFGKFGLMMFDGNGLKSGLLYYADAACNDNKEITGTNLGVVPGTDDYNWAEGSSTPGLFDSKKEITLSVAYEAERGYAYFFYSTDGGEEQLLTQVRFRTDKDIVVGFKSFAITLEVTDYYCTNNLSEFEDKLPEVRFEGNTLGSTENYDYGANWVIDKDYAKDSENYGERMVELTGHDGKDNNIFFKETEGKEAYVRATFKLTQAYAGEKWGKFGFMLFDEGLQTGTFFYVDAWIGDANDGVFRGRELGYNYAPNGWGTWNTLIKAGNVFDTTTKTITLAMTYADNVVSMYYENANGDDVLVNQCVYAAHSDKFILGIKSFAYGMQVTDYFANTDKTSQEFIDHNPEMKREAIDVLVAGDSYTEFWMNYGVWNTLTYDLTSAGKKLADVGVGGTQVPYWNNDGQIGALQMSYNPENILFHIGVNDIDAPVNKDSDEKNAQAVYDRLVSLFENYHEAFPEANIFWVGVIPNNFYIKHSGETVTTYNEAYKLLNAKVKELAETLDYLNYIDQWTSFANEEGEVRANLMMNDGLHLNPIYGYPLWTANIKKALYPDVTADWDNEEYVLGASGSRVPTPAWVYGKDGNLARLDYRYGDTGVKVNVEENIYYKAEPSADILFEAEIRSNGLHNVDAWSKVGVSLVNDDVTIFAYCETNSDNTLSGIKLNYVSLVARGNHRNNWNNGEWGLGVGDWNWNNQAGAQIAERDINKDFVRIGIAKRGATIYLLADGAVVASTDKFPEVKEGSKFTAGITSFSRNVEIKSVNYTANADEIEMGLAAAHSISVPDYSADGITVNLNKTTAKKTEEISFTITNNGDSVIDKVYAVYGGADNELTAEEGTYTFVMPDEAVTLKITFVGKKTITLGEGAIDKINVSKLSVNPGTEVTFTAKENVSIGKIYYTVGDGEPVEIVPADGVYKLEVNEDVTITAVTYFTIDGIILDGIRDEAYGAASTEAKLNDNRNMQVWAKKTEQGVFIYAMSHSNEYKDNGGDWWDNSNFEFYLNNGDQLCVNSKGYKQVVTEYFTKYTKLADEANAYNGKWENIYEIFVAKESIANFDNGDIQLNYAFKTGNGIDKAGYESDFIVQGAVTRNYDWWSYHAVGGCGSDAGWFNGFNYNSAKPANLFIGTDGIKKVKATAKDAVIDGELESDVWDAKAGLNNLGSADKAQFEVKAFAGTDGLYIGMKIVHGNWSSANPSGDWSTHDNVEIHINCIGNAIVFINGKLCAPALFDQTAAKTVEEDGKLVTVVELFASGVAEQYRLQMGCNGDGFGGWQELFWGGNIGYVTADGLTLTNKLGEIASNAGITLDGEFNDSVWTEEVTEKTYTAFANGAEISVMGVNTSAGVLLGFTVKHNKPVNEHCQGDGTQWWNYMGPEIRLANLWGKQICATTWNNYTQLCMQGNKTVENGEGVDYRYTTTYEMLIDYGEIGCVSDRPIKIACAGVFENGFTTLFGGAWGDNFVNASHVITANGMIYVR